MKRILSISIALALAALMVASSVVLAWDGAPTIRDETFYVPSSPLTLGPWTTVYMGVQGWVIANPFQINLEYQPGILDSDIANLNTYMFPANAAFPPGHTNGTWLKNFSDNTEYVLNVNPAGGLTVYDYGGMTAIPDPNIQWTLTGWYQTILAGDIINNPDGTITLRVQPATTYRPFVSDPPASSVEVFDGPVQTEVWGYRFGGSALVLGAGSEVDPILDGPVGWETYPISKVRVLLPWIALAAAIIVSGSLLVVRRRRVQT
jgi:hypothetical protein